ncbi:bifunctional UDP-sugar hydrolase/5'-nucleotidase [Tessaracoccus sp. ZS01]|uniref:bifunctional metallophosphatase/5'-nucleotidase n=1 Tax=Tessaracoccus sp. ZS01 TaxID=1906324 RepID=UPI00096F369C|nr:5'-nucleotidase C-terminal domain-containing protein [Tessaracoccus sp. ZS01]MCG6568389.1 bifunctional metallophosphatase/5'-nucleotidase [Tessaracoccus sp. ZS01]OMG52795.1 bifunctional metallophosphatase/5'-nucleotidase [Tessaracoccus sp. ZS01]
MRTPIALAAAVALGVTLVTPATAAPNPRSEQTTQVTVLATSDVHGNVQNWNYFSNQPYSERAGHEIGLAQVSSIVESVREERGADSVFVVDNGDFLQGTPLTTYYAKQEPITVTGDTHPMADAFNHIGYDAQNLGNHEFNYGLDLLDAYIDEAAHPVLGANVVDAETGEPAYQPFELVTRKVSDNKPVTIGFLGLTTPGSMIWDKAILEGEVRITDMVDAAQYWVPKVREAGADIVVVLSHAGVGLSSYDTEATGLGDENPAADIAREVPGIDAMVLGHTHRDAPVQRITNEVTGRDVLLTQPRWWASGVSDLTFDLQKVRGQWTVVSADAAPIYSRDFAPDEEFLAELEDAHTTTVDYVNTMIATSLAELPATESRYRDTAIIDYIQMVQTQTVQQALAGTEHGDLPVLSIAAPFSRTAVFPEGDVTIRDMAGLYIYDNTLEAVVMTGAEIRDYLEFSAKYFAQLPSGATFDPKLHTSVVHDGQQVWDYNYDILSGVDYEIDLTQPVGSRISDVTLDGVSVADDQQFVVAVNNYRRSGGGNFPHIASAPVVYNEMQEIRQLLIDWAVANQVIDQSQFFQDNWRLVIDGAPV